MTEEAIPKIKKLHNIAIEPDVKLATRKGLSAYFPDHLRKAHAASKPKDKLQSEETWTPLEPPSLVMAPDLEMACNNIRHRLATFPLEQLPLSYNGLILRIIEALQKSVIALAEAKRREPNKPEADTADESASAKASNLSRAVELDGDFFEKLMDGRYGPKPDEVGLLRDKTSARGVNAASGMHD